MEKYFKLIITGNASETCATMITVTEQLNTENDTGQTVDELYIRRIAHMVGLPALYSYETVL